MTAHVKSSAVSGPSAFIGPLPDGWGSFPWMYHAYYELLNRVARLGTVDAKGNNVQAKDTAGHIKNNPRIMEYFTATSDRTNTENEPWCSAFTNWCISRAGIQGTKKPNARSWLTWHQGEKLHKPLIGAIVVFPRPPKDYQGHVAMVWNVLHSGSIHVLGGNQGGQKADKHHPAGIASHVSITRPHHEALGYLWPKGFPKPDEAAAKKLIHAATLKVPADLRP